MLGPEANHFVTVGHPENFHWRESSFGDLIPLLGDGLLTVDDAYHDRARAIMLPAFHREQVEASTAAMALEAEAAIAALAPDTVIDVYAWMRQLAMRIAMRALLGLDPDDGGKGAAGGGELRAGARLLRHRLRPPPAARPGLALAPAAGRPRGDRPDRLRGDRPPPRRPRQRRAATSSACWSSARGERRRALHRHRDPRPGDDADVRRPRHLDRDRQLRPPRTRPPPGRARAPLRGAGPGARRGAADDRPAGARAALPGHGRRRGPAPLPARLDRPAPRRPRLRVGRLRGAEGRLRQLLLLGQPPASPRSSPSPRPSSPSASPASAKRRCRAAPTSPSAAAKGSASANASA